MRKFGARSVLGTGLVLGAAFGCGTNVTVVEPPPPGQPSTSAFNGATHQASSAPLPISGGTLLTITKQDGSAIAVVADPEEDVIDVVGLGASPALLGTLSLQPGDEPGRMVADAGGRVHVVLRSGGAIATIVPNANGASLTMRRSVCSAPRGIDYDAASDSLYVACATGEVAVLPAGGGAATATADFGHDLRDVVIDGSNVYITRFRNPTVLMLDKALNLQRETPIIVPSSLQNAGTPSVAWRAAREWGGGAQVVFQVASTTPIDVATPPGVSSYGGSQGSQQINGGAGGVVTVAVASFTNGALTSDPIPLTTNPVVDVASAPDGTFETISITGAIETTASINNGTGPLQVTTLHPASDLTIDSPDEFVAIADAQTAQYPSIVVQRRGMSPALLVMPTSALNGPATNAPIEVQLPQKSLHVDTGFDVFHIPTPAGIACMNCHPEGGDDGHVWQFQLQTETRARRTQSLHGGVLQDSAPYHWDGDMVDLQTLCNEVFTHRMGGGSLSADQTPILARFVNAIPRVPVKATLDQTAVAHGQAIFQSAGCPTCHVNGTGTMTANQDIGKTDVFFNTSVPLQVPMLIDVADRAPYMHDGCAPTLLDRLTVNSCTGTKHGDTAMISKLSPDDKQNLVQYLESL